MYVLYFSFTFSCFKNVFLTVIIESTTNYSWCCSSFYKYYIDCFTDFWFVNYFWNIVCTEWQWILYFVLKIEFRISASAICKKSLLRFFKSILTEPEVEVLVYIQKSLFFSIFIFILGTLRNNTLKLFCNITFPMKSLFFFSQIFVAFEIILWYTMKHF